MIYADASALGRAYFPDEPDHAALRTLLLDGQELVVTSTLTRVEIAAAAHRAARAGRIRDARLIVDRFDADCAAGGPIMRLRLRPTAAFRRAVELVSDHALRALDALHLTVALTDGLTLAGDEPLVFVTRAVEQSAAAKACGLTVG
ncbi:MAG: type II toxin-antitoxin system VapC family toxin [Egibacteraceae bacterium]